MRRKLISKRTHCQSKENYGGLEKRGTKEVSLNRESSTESKVYDNSRRHKQCNPVNWGKLNRTSNKSDRNSRVVTTE